MGEWKRIVPDENELPGVVIFAVIFAAFAVLFAGMVLVAPGKVVGWWGMSSAIALCAGMACFLWRAGRTGVHFGPRGVLVHPATRAAEVVPWDEFVRFEVRPERAAGVAPRGAVVHVVRTTGDPVATPLKQSIDADWNRTFYFFEVVLSEVEFADALARLNAWAVAYTSRE
ncbi:hypothetical protein [Lentzea sp. NBRC 102530]|uniref:hypothetical protein n=1 Tax=Lentzea sp. NBRC 102530 TaxID=3032201 RepID=UPI002552CCA8|nr:hypothetical protein [Lentzea sp. NBRC 102530]